MTKNLKAARKYSELGYSVIPVRPDKKPAIKWQEFQQRKPTDQELEKWFSKGDMQLGIVTGKISGLTVVDIDSEAGKEVVEGLVGETFLTPIATTPRGGRHLYLKYVPEAVNRANQLPGVDIRSDGGFVVAPPSRGKNGNGYAWLEGLTPLQVSPAAAPMRLLKRIITNKDTKYDYNSPIVRSCDSPENQESFKELQEASSGFVSFAEPGRDQTLFHLAWHLVKGNMPDANIRKYLDFVGANCKPPFPPKERETKIESALKRANDQNIDIAREVYELVEASTGIIEASMCCRELQVASKHQRRLVQQALRRLADKGELLERVENARAGTFRRVDNSVVKINIEKPKMSSLDVTWPLELEELFRTLPKNIIVLAGDQDAGKTCFLLNFVKRNQHKFPIRYLNSEMGADEFNGRLENFHEPLSFWKMEVEERAANFHQRLLPDGCTVIDYLEVHENFFEIGKRLKEIHDRLRTGFALVAIQKKAGQELGRGAEFSLEKPRLYLSLSKDYPGQKIKIIKCKNWRDPKRNPNGLQRKFKIGGGATIKPITEWERNSK